VIDETRDEETPEEETPATEAEATPEETPAEEKPKPRRRRKKAEPKEEPVAEEAAADDASEDDAAPAVDEAEAAEDEADEQPDADEEAPAKKPRRRRRKAADEEAEEEQPQPKTPAPVGRDGRPTVRAHAKYVRTSARKARLVGDHVRGKSVDEARAILAMSPRSVARDWSKVLESAIANAEHNHELIGDDLRLAEVYADEGPTLKRYRPRAMGRATRIRKRTSHLTIMLSPKE
jgi:large subunit ribosomal protein L22